MGFYFLTPKTHLTNRASETQRKNGLNTPTCKNHFDLSLFCCCCFLFCFDGGLSLIIDQQQKINHNKSNVSDLEQTIIIVYAYIMSLHTHTHTHKHTHTQRFVLPSLLQKQVNKS